MRVVPMLVTEEAQRLLRATRADFSRLPTFSLPGRGAAVGASTFGVYDFEQARNQSEYLRLVSIVEAYIDACASDQFRMRLRGHEAFVHTLASEVDEVARKGWDERVRVFKKYHGVNLGTCAKWSDIDAAREVRNSIAHGLGRLTPRQQNGKARGKITGMGVRFRGDLLLIDDVALERVAKSSLAFIADVDRKLSVRK